MYNKKKEVMARYLGIDDIQLDEDHNYYGLTTVLIGDKEFAIGTEEEAERACKDSILEIVWAFVPHFIIEHSKVLDFDKASNFIVKAISDQCENGNEAMKKLIDNLDDFANDAMNEDGRGHFLSSYDGKEEEFQYEGQIYYIYRIN